MSIDDDRPLNRREKIVTKSRAHPLIAAITVVVVVAIVGAGVGVGAYAHDLSKPVPISAWITYWDDGSGVKSLAEHKGKIAEVHPYWYEAHSATDVETKVPRPLRESTLQAATNSKMKVVPAITETMNTRDFQAMVLDESQRRSHVQAVCNLVRDNLYDGIDLDYQTFALDASPGNAGVLAEQFVTLVNEIGTCVHAQSGKIEVSVMARANDVSYASERMQRAMNAFDYKALGKAADVVRPMAYDFTQPGESAGPTDPIQWIDAVAKYATERIPSRKVDLGLPLYGQDFAGKTVTTVPQAKIADLITRYGANPQVDTSTHSSTFDYREANVIHHVWYENVAQVRDRLEVARQHHIGGATFWTIGWEDPTFWT